MATVNLGAIKFNWKGAYNNSTAYAVDDVVSSSGSSYVCILASQGNAVSNGTYWNIMSSAGTNGTDVGTTLTTQGDILYRDGSGLQRLGAGTSGQALITGGTGANPSWGDAGGGKVNQVVVATNDATENGHDSMSYADFTSNPTISITPTATSSKILIEFSAVFSCGGSSNGADIAITDNSNNIIVETGMYGTRRNALTLWGLHTANTTSQVTYKIRGKVNSSGGHFIYLDSGTSNPKRTVFWRATEILA